MTLSAPNTIYGIHHFTFFNRTSKLPVGILKCLGSVGISLNGSFNDLYGGSSRYAWDSEAGVLDTTISLNTKQFEDFLFTQCLGAAASENSAEASGNVGTLTNQVGTSVAKADTGIASVALKSGAAAELKSGLYVVKAATTTTINVYCLGDVDFDEGTDEVYEDDTLLINSSPLTITDSGGTTDLDNFGLTFTGGSGTVAMTADDTAYFWVRKVNGGSTIVTVGQSTASFSEFGVLWTSQKKSNGDIFEVYVPRAKSIGLPLEMSEAAWASAAVSLKALRDADANMVFQTRLIKGA